MSIIKIHKPNEAKDCIIDTKFCPPYRRGKCLNCKKDMNCFVYDGGDGEYGVYVLCDDCDKLEFEWKYEGY